MSHISGFRARWTAGAALFALVLGMSALPAVSTAPARAELKPGGFMSTNVSWVAHLPIDSPGIGARIVKVGEQTRFYVTGAKGLTIYDITNPALPLPLGTHPLPHWENEDVSVSADGNWTIISTDTNFGGDLSGYSFVLDTSDPRVPKWVSTIPAGAHISSCADDDCNILYGSDGWTYDLTDKANPKQVIPGWKSYIAAQGVRFSDSVHDLNRDAAGYFTTDSTPRVMFDPRPDPRKPRLLTTGPSSSPLKLAYQHNNIRPNADQWRPRVTAEEQADPNLQPGELLLSNGETNFKAECNAGSGPFATWSARDWDKGAQMKPLHVFRPVTGTYQDGNPRVNAIGCSGHWFTYRNGIAAAGWYEHGTRFLAVDERTGAISEVGFFQPVVGSASAAHWVNDEYVYIVDYARGIDIVRFDRNAPRPGPAVIAQSWARPTAGLDPATAAERWRCALAQQ